MKWWGCEPELTTQVGEILPVLLSGLHGNKYVLHLFGAGKPRKQHKTACKLEDQGQACGTDSRVGSPSHSQWVLQECSGIRQGTKLG